MGTHLIFPYWSVSPLRAAPRQGFRDKLVRVSPCPSLFPYRALCIVVVCAGCYHHIVFLFLKYNHMLLISQSFSLALSALLCFMKSNIWWMSPADSPVGLQRQCAQNWSFICFCFCTLPSACPFPVDHILSVVSQSIQPLRQELGRHPSSLPIPCCLCGVRHQIWTHLPP